MSSAREDCEGHAQFSSKREDYDRVGGHGHQVGEAVFAPGNNEKILDTIEAVQASGMPDAEALECFKRQLKDKFEAAGAGLERKGEEAVKAAMDVERIVGA